VGLGVSGVDVAAVVARLEAAGCLAADEAAADYAALAPDEATLEAWLRRREQGEPSAWITGTMVFCGRPLHVAPGVFVPREQTEELARRAAGLLPVNGRALDLCTGAGAVGAHLRAEVPTATVVGVDLDERATRCAGRNGVAAMVADLDAAIGPGTTFDVVTAVAPYVPTADLRLLPADVQHYEPRLALDGGVDGLDVVRRVVAGAARRLRPSGWLLIEVGGDQDEALAPTLAAHGFGAVTTWCDEDGDLRGLAAHLTDFYAAGGA
jgi:release factor glutamine methyltransferase